MADSGDRTRGAITGGVAGAIGGGVGGLLAGPAGIAATSSARLAVAGVAAGVAENTTNQYLSTGSIDWRQTVIAGGLGGILGPAGKVAAKYAGRLRAAISGCGGRHSFAPTTAVLMADGSTKEIEDIDLGDQVTATDPQTGEQAAKPVIQLHEHVDQDLTDVTVRDSEEGTTTVLHTTQHHPFWDATDQRWVDAAQLGPGHRLLTGDDGSGTEVTVVEVNNFTGSQNMRDLTVADIHTYYVVADGDPVLVHNLDCPQIPLNAADSDVAQVAMDYRVQNRVATGDNIAVFRIGEGENVQYLVARNVPGGLHSEEILDQYVTKNKIDPDSITAIYSERIPCLGHKCAAIVGRYGNATQRFSLNSDEAGPWIRRDNMRRIGRAMADYRGPSAAMPPMKTITWIN